MARVSRASTPSTSFWSQASSKSLPVTLSFIVRTEALHGSSASLPGGMRDVLHYGVAMKWKPVSRRRKPQESLLGHGTKIAAAEIGPSAPRSAPLHSAPSSSSRPPAICPGGRGIGFDRRRETERIGRYPLEIKRLEISSRWL